MARFGTLGTQYFDSAGDPLSGGKIWFYESGSVETTKTTYSDADQSVANTNPVILDADGRQGDIFFSGSAAAKVLDSDDTVVVGVMDPIGTATSGAPLAAWNTLITYDIEDIAKGSDDRYYQSIISDNSAQDPTSTSDKWQEIRFVAVWENDYTYLAGALVTAPIDNAFYRCINGASQGDEPTATPGEWALVGSSGMSALIDDTTPKLGGNLDMNGKILSGAAIFDSGIQLEAANWPVITDTLTLVNTNGSVSFLNISQNVTTTVDSLTNGQFLVLRISDAGGIYTIDWAGASVVWVGGTAPTIPGTGSAWVELWKYGSVLFGNYKGDTTT